MCSTISVVIADDHPTFRIGVRSLLKTERDLPLIGEASNAADAVERTLTLKPDILLLHHRGGGRQLSASGGGMGGGQDWRLSLVADVVVWARVLSCWSRHSAFTTGGRGTAVRGDGYVGNGQRSYFPARAPALLAACWHPHRTCRGGGRTRRFPSPLHRWRAERSDGTVQPGIVPFRCGISSRSFRASPVGHRLAHYMELALGGTCRHFLLSLVRQKLGQQRKLILSLGPR
jgi:hypothetical protein